MPAPSLSVPRAARARRRLLLPLLLVLPLAVGGCDAIYEDTKGWANRLEVSLLSATHDETAPADAPARSEEHTSELQSLMRISYAVFCLKKKKNQKTNKQTQTKNMN